MKKYMLILLAAAGLAACKDKKPATEETKEVTTVVADPAADSAAIRGVILDFYTWYTANDEKLMNYKLYSGIKKADQPPYKINWDEVDRYQAFIRDSVPQLGQAFLADQKKMFQQCDSAFKVDVNDDIPYGFDYDWFTNSQEDPSYLLEGLKTSGKWVIQAKEDQASVEIANPENKNYVSGALLLYVGLRKENGQWKIAKIGND